MKTTALRHTGSRAATGIVLVMAATLLLVLLGTARGPNVADFPLPVFSRFGDSLAEDLPTIWPFLGDNVKRTEKPRASVASGDPLVAGRPAVSPASGGVILAPDFTVAAEPAPVGRTGLAPVVAVVEGGDGTINPTDVPTKQASTVDEESSKKPEPAQAEPAKKATKPDTKPAQPPEAKQTSSAKETSASKAAAKQVAGTKKPSPAKREQPGAKAVAKGRQRHDLATTGSNAGGHRLQRPSAAGHRQPVRAQKLLTRSSTGKAAQHPSAAGHSGKRQAR